MLASLRTSSMSYTASPECRQACMSIAREELEDKDMEHLGQDPGGTHPCRFLNRTGACTTPEDGEPLADKPIS